MAITLLDAAQFSKLAYSGANASGWTRVRTSSDPDLTSAVTDISGWRM